VALEALWRAIGRFASARIASNGFSGAANELEGMAPTRFYSTLKRYYDGLELYKQVGPDAPKPLRNPARRVVEFHASHLWPGTLPDALPLETDNEALPDAIKKLWEWSNWNDRKQVFARHLALYGDAFIKIASDPEKGLVWLEVVEPRWVVSFREDPRGNIEHLRIDKPILPPLDSRPQPNIWTRTEIWDTGDSYEAKNSGGVIPTTEPTHSVHIHLQGIGASWLTLGDPTERHPLSEYGLDYVPAVHAKFQDAGDELTGGRGVGAFAPYLDLIDEANRLATRRHEMMFRYGKNLWAIRANMMDPEGNPIPAPRFQYSPEGNALGSPAVPVGEPDTMALGKDQVVRLPGNSELQSLIPNVDYGGGRDMDSDLQKEMAESMPEMIYYVTELTRNLSGVAIRLLLEGAIDRALEARGNGEAAQIAANKMGLEVAQWMELPGFESETIGTSQGGDFEHHFRAREVIPQTPEENLQNKSQEVLNALNAQKLGADTTQLLKNLGYEQAAPAGETPNRQAVLDRSRELLGVAVDGTADQKNTAPNATASVGQASNSPQANGRSS